MVARSRWVGALLVVFVGCGEGGRLDASACADPGAGQIGPDGTPGLCHDQEADGGSGCESGEVVHWTAGWDEPSWLWIGPEALAPDCPYGPMSTAYEGHADLVAPPGCEACACEPPTGSCALPSTLTASTTACNIPGGSSTSYDAPSPWDGHCDDTTQVPSGLAHSLTIGALGINENGCAPTPPVPAKVISLRWDTYGRACDVKGWSPGPIMRSVCIPDDPLPPGYHLCMFQKGKSTCPGTTGNVFTEQHVFYQGVEDNRKCSTCSCGSPIGSACTATVSVYKGGDLTCGGPSVVQLPVSSVSATCVDIQLPGQALGSKSTGPTTYLPGACPPMGGDPSGLATETEPSTYCCRP